MDDNEQKYLNPNQQYYGGQQPPPPQAYGQPAYSGQPGYGQAGFQQPGFQQPGFQQPGFQQQPGYVHPGFQQPGYAPQQPGYGGPQDGPYDSQDPKDGNLFEDAAIRRGFIRKVYSILMVQLSVGVLFIAFCVYHAGTNRFLRSHPELMWIAIIILFVTLIALACCEGVRRSFPTNFIFLGLFTLAQTFMLGVMTARVPADTVLLAVGATAAVCLGLTLFAFQTKWDFTTCNGILFVALILFMIFGLVAMFYPGKIMNLVYASCGAFLFSIYLIYDTQMMMGGSHKYSISPEEYIFAALNLYMDIINIFIYILAILSATRD